MRPRRSPDLVLRYGLALALGVAAIMLSSPVLAAGAVPVAAAATGPAWAELTPAERDALKPLQRDWNNIDAPRKRKWLEIAGRFPRLDPAEQQRIQARMADWAKLTPTQRGQARLNFQEAKQQTGREERQARWQAYQALPENERKELAARAAAKRIPPDGASKTGAANRAAAQLHGGKPAVADAVAAQAKSNIVPNPLHSAPRPKPVTPTVVQAKPGATTTLMSRRPTPPLHQQTGLPKIAATPEFVDSATLLPQRGAQGAAIELVPAGD